MKRKKWYLILQRKTNRVYGSFPRTKEGKVAALAYIDGLMKENKEKFKLQ